MKNFLEICNGTLKKQYSLKMKMEGAILIAFEKHLLILQIVGGTTNFTM